MSKKPFLLGWLAAALMPCAAVAQSAPQETPTPFLGIATETIPGKLGEDLGLPEGLGLLVVYVAPNSPAEAAGIRRYDVLRRMDDQILAQPTQLTALVRNLEPGREIVLTLLRGTRETKATVKLGKQQTPEQARASASDQTEAVRIPLNDPQASAMDILQRTALEIRAAQNALSVPEVRPPEVVIAGDTNAPKSAAGLDYRQQRIRLTYAGSYIEIVGSGKDTRLTVENPAGDVIFGGRLWNAPPKILNQVARAFTESTAALPPTSPAKPTPAPTP